MANHSSTPCRQSLRNLRSKAATRRRAQISSAVAVGLGLRSMAASLFFCPLAVDPNGSELF